ncbi:octopamine receptor-like [Mercenaria mercenaria]|uniref:octopamine receptor-like n=1 Tax=Mercenaria mercenaria TaxID=6596 RepID=UPI00234ED616|nr:octopamine receptor-like [Mercenaria mercenaria]XP_045213814.2 octopamine receptor-like [Mercenaria mercenaria]XP_045213815.2 octopamine receptor-like [Mercenaria mercenaria]XP_045213816.2 octopamine receptor-like [Mercenaria mercenaria]
MRNYTSDNDDILERTRYDIFRHLLPVIICMILFGVAGIVGNILTFIFYTYKSKRSSTVMLIACLAIVDLVVCVLFIPNIIEMWVNVKYTSSFMCKFAHFVGLWTVASSALILWVVAIDRHRKICSPFGKQMTLVTTKYAVIAIIVFGFALSVRNFANYDSVEVNVKENDLNITIQGHYCTTTDDDKYTVSVAVFTIIDFLLVLMICLTLAVAYSHIIYTIFKLKKTRKRLHPKPKVIEMEISTPSHEAQSQDEISTKQPTSDKDENEKRKVSSSSYVDGKQISDLDISTEDSRQSVMSNDAATRTSSSVQDSGPSDEYPSDCPSLRDTGHLQDEVTLSSGSHSKSTFQKIFNGHKQPKRYNSAKCAVERNLTFKMLAVSIVFIVCFTPYFIVKILMREVLKTGEEYELNLLAQISLRLPYMNSVFNPVVYCAFNPQFRLYIKSFFFLA